MTYSNPRAALSQYKQSSLQTEVSAASPHRLIQMLMGGVLEKIATARGHMERGDTQEKGRNIGWAISIISSLHQSLDFEQGGEIAGNLEALYDYMIRQLTQANLSNSIEKLDEVADLMRDIKAGWDEIPASYHHRTANSAGASYVTA
ncbi:flagellar protein FliS [Thiohalospira halophila DSM 15071]|uniref:Flagellar secretion chaperone FliS n=1 Tax=Thiohalospira halophila DSM 15071 TaxID=1123397 RepID=A0A1I1WIG8_9GAMM|nr:flagellar export chaperone FliS [Thiohalospira halophila]SFD92900.1 flagellar protein FliS [Thiohalospira halophila DSM 15071]